MIPIKLTIEGLYSYQKKQTIDFELLTQSQIFGIFGATGSGKSSILEAIGFALYGKTERLSQADKRNYNMMNLKSNRLFIDFEFEAGDKHYKFEVNARRNSKRFEEVAKIERKAYVQEENDWIPLQSADASSILGLSYDNFKRTIIIPQGKFQEFLQLGDTDRTRMLKDIFHLDKYELFDQAAVLDKENQHLITQQEAVLQTLSNSSPEVLAETEAQLATCKQSIKETKSELELRQKKFHRLEEKKIQLDRLMTLQQNLQELESQENNWQQRETRLIQYEDCLVNFKPILDKEKEVDQTFKRVKQQLIHKKERLQTIRSDWERAQKTFVDIQQRFEQRDKLKQQADELLQIISLQEIERIRNDRADRIAKGSQMITEKEAQIKAIQERRQTLSVTIEQSKDQQLEMASLFQLQHWFQQQAQQKQQRQQVETELKELRLRANELSQKQRKILSPFLPPSQLQLTTDQLTPILQQQQQQAQQSLDQQQAQLTQLRLQSHLHQISAQLKDGAPCPICGATHHPDKQDYGHVTGMEAEVLEKIDQTKTNIQALAEALLHINNHAEQQAALAADIERRQLAIQQLDTRVGQLPESAKQLGINDIEALQNKIKEAQALEVAIRQQEVELKSLLESEDEENKLLQTYRAALESRKQQFQEQEIAFTAGVQALKLFDYANYAQLDALHIRAESDKLKQDYLQIEGTYRNVEQHVQELRTQLDHLQGEIETEEKQSKQLQRQLAEQRRKLLEQASSSQYEDVKDIQGILSNPINTSAERNAISQYRQQLEATKASVQELQLQLKDTHFDEKAFAALAESIQKQQEEMEGLTRELGGLQQAHQRIQAELEKQKELHKQIQTLRERAEDINTLKRLFSRSGFVNYISTIYLENLCRAANQRFMKFTRGSLRLETTTNNQFQVRDFLHEGQLRSIKTLSGGQTFQAALSLALALADQVQQQVQAKQNFFFLDEGFGSQDKESLQLIFQSLKTLRKENRIVGVISHVEELQQEISAYLQITNDPEEGSLVKGSW